HGAELPRADGHVARARAHRARRGARVLAVPRARLSAGTPPLHARPPGGAGALRRARSPGMRLLVPPARVLVRAPSWLGDLVAAEPVLRALHARWSAAGCADRITIAAPAPLLALLDGRFGGVRRSPV